MQQIVDTLLDQLDEQLRIVRKSLEGAKAEMDAAVAAERERCAQIAEGCAMTRPSFIGPLHGTGWNAAVEQIATKIREG